jgi:alkylation response protein AidB-like acyl-CoA dehydrogenase
MMAGPLFTQYQAAQDLEDWLGDPREHACAFNFACAVASDEREEPPEAALRLLDEWGANLYYAPISEGGRMETLEQMFALGRVVSRRDLSAIISHGISFLGFMVLQVAASREIRADALAVLRHHGRIALGLTEKEHGGDLSNCECHAELRDGRYFLSGEKWLINSGTTGEAISCFVRTNPAGGPRGFSFFFVQKAALPPHTFQHMPRVPTHGIRGVDISGIRFLNAPIEPSCLVGAEGMGLEIALKTLQVTRSMCSNLSLGAVDTALRMTVDFALARRIYGRSVWDIPVARSALAEVFIDLFICDCVSTSAARALHVMPEQMSVISSIVKYHVPVTLEKAMQSLKTVLGARYYLRQEHWAGIFQKILRDIDVVALFDGSTAVNLNMISVQLLSLCSAVSVDREETNRLRRTCRLDAPLPPFSPERLRLFNNGKLTLTQFIPMLGDYVSERTRDLPGMAFDDIQSALAALAEEYASFCASIAQNPAGARSGSGQTKAIFDASRTYCIMYAAAACALFWTENRDEIDDFFGKPEWLQCALHRLLGQLRTGAGNPPASADAIVCEELRRRCQHDIQFSIVPLFLARQEASLNVGYVNA